MTKLPRRGQRCRAGGVLVTTYSDVQRRAWRQAAAPSRTRWDSLPTTLHRGELASLLSLIPYFERRPFVAATASGAATAPNGRLDMVLRSATDKPEGGEVPVAVVSKRYQLLQHRSVVMLAARALESVEPHLDIGGLDVELELTEYGERMALHVFLPPEFDFVPPDGHALGLRLSCFNTVDGSAKFLAAVGWLRFVCANGMVVGEVKSRLHQSHTIMLDPARIGEVLVKGLKQSKLDRERISAQAEHQVSVSQVQWWADTVVAAAWGPVAACRTIHIAATGRDAEVVQIRRSCFPSQYQTKSLGPVPGAAAPAANLYDVSQILTWLAHGRPDMSERQAWMAKVPDLLDALSA